MSWILLIQLLILLLFVVVLVSFVLDTYLDKRVRVIDAETERYRARKALAEADFAATANRARATLTNSSE